MLLLKLVFWIGLALVLPHSSHQSCSEESLKQCLQAEFAPGTNLGGQGFDVTKMEITDTYVIDMNDWIHKDKTCTLCSNPYLDNKKQKLPLAVTTWTAKHSCSTKVSSQLHKTSTSLLVSNSKAILNSWNNSLSIPIKEATVNLMLAGTNSKVATYSAEKTKTDKYIFSSQSVSCQYYSYTISKSPKLHKDFQQAIKQLPKNYTATTKKDFYKLIENFGTHYFTQVNIGGSVQAVTSIRECQPQLQGLSLEEVEMCLQAEGSVTLEATVSALLKHCKKDQEMMEGHQSFADMYNDRLTEIRGGHTSDPDLLFSAQKDPSAYKEWLNSLPQHPDVISYSLESLHMLLPSKDPSHSNLRSAISHYILERGLWKNCSAPCPAGVKTDPRDPCVCQCHNNAGVNQDCCPTQRGIAQVAITVQRAEKIWGDTHSESDGYVKVFIDKKQIFATRYIRDNNNPVWDHEVNLGTMDLSSGYELHFEVWDRDNGWNDDFLGGCTRKLTSGVGEDVCTLQYGQLFFKLQVECAPSLTGQLCTDYAPTPMNPTLKGWFKSRDAHPVPEALLQKWGVFKDG
ncbi:hypothetical protein WMY93_003293 [Mugilogobius chulae]|uniref:Perforin-1-like n=1 Tax=Mugilogobius chulae TaxID=88201 RepID=A0AAW0Q613_9GOBI